MKILIITTYFYPDTAISAKRPFYFAKYLSRLGHNITVLRSGIINGKIDKSIDLSNLGFRVISYLGRNSTAERYANGENISFSENESRISFLPYNIRKPISDFYHRITRFNHINKENALIDNRLAFLKKSLIELKENGEKFDIVFSTFGSLENALVGDFASNLFNCSWILDLRDHMITKQLGYKYKKKITNIEKNAISSASMVTAVSNDLVFTIQKRYPRKKIVTLYNGYEPLEEIERAFNVEDVLSFCYTGNLYSGQRDLTDLFRTIKDLSTNGKIDKNKIRVNYAGYNFEVLNEQAKKFGLEKILVNHGFITRNEAFKLQAESDVFVVASWNTKDEKGILTGKFYEGIQAGKPILSIISGDEPDSELYEMNKQYNYGFCYECCRRKTDFNKLCDYILFLYNSKIQKGKIDYNPNPLLAEDFKYETITKRLEMLMKEIAKERQ